MRKISINFNQPVPLFCAEVLHKYCGFLAVMKDINVLSDGEYKLLLSEISAEETIIKKGV